MPSPAKDIKQNGSTQAGAGKTAPKGETESPLTRRAAIDLGLAFCLLVLGIVTIGTVYYRTHERRLRIEVEQQLSSIADLKVGEIAHWRKERLEDGSVFFRNPAFTTLVKQCIEKPDDSEVQTRLRTWLGKIQLQYSRVSLQDARGMERMSVPDAVSQVSAGFSLSAIEALKTRCVIFEDFFRDGQTKKVYLAVQVPILDEQNEDRVIGILSLRIDPARYLFPFLQRWPTPSETAETLLVRREGDAVVFLNRLRFVNNSPLSFRVPLTKHDLPAVNAVLGKSGVFEGRDYRNVQVLAALRAIPESPWFMVARRDLAEVNTPLREQLRIAFLLSATLILGAAATIGMIWRQYSNRLYREKLAASEALQEEQNLILTLMENLPANIYFKDASCSFLRVNPAMARAFGLSDPSQIVGKSDADFFPEDVARQFMADEKEIIRTGRPVLNIVQKTRWHGSETGGWEMVSKLPLHDAAGRIIGTCGISVDITERKRAEEALRKTGVELVNKNAELERFLYTASHDLKSPLVTVKTFLGYMKQDMASADSEQIEKDMLYINSAADKMGQLLEDLLEMSRIGRVINPPVRITFKTAVNEALATVAGRITTQGVTVTVAENDVILYGDRRRLTEIWQNLVDNACKFMGGQKEPRIEIGVDMRGDETVFYVRDNGIGIDPRYQAKVFDLFEKLDPKVEGSGIGLTIIKRIVEIYGGWIKLESAGPGQGAAFLFTLPDAVNHAKDSQGKIL